MAGEIAARDQEIQRWSRRYSEELGALHAELAGLQKSMHVCTEERQVLRAEVASHVAVRTLIEQRVEALEHAASQTEHELKEQVSRLERALLLADLRRGTERSARRRTRRDARLILSSGLLDCNWYRSAYPDLQGVPDHVAAVHYMRHGAAEGRNPNPIFNTNWYLATYRDVAEAGINPLVHYVCWGSTEGRDPGPDFSTIGYLQANTDVAIAGTEPLLHFLRFGAAEGRQPKPQLDPASFVRHAGQV
jgi:hypothetical protein